jgi:peptidyl-prolyl cis-trans isomerase C
MTITVNGTVISDREIAAEMQYHPAPSVAQARDAAARALVVRQLLLQEARRLGFDGEDEGALDRLLASEVSVPEADDAACQRYYKRHRHRLRTLELYEAHHILIAVVPGDAVAVERAKATAAALIATLARESGRFAELAAAHSDCRSKEAGGSLGQVTRGDVAPELATFLVALDEGQLCPVPVRTRHGWHVLRLDRRGAGAQLPYEAVRDRIAAHLAEVVWRRAVSEYIGLLAGRAEIAGIEIRGWDTPLVQ